MTEESWTRSSPKLQEEHGKLRGEKKEESFDEDNCFNPKDATYASLLRDKHFRLYLSSILISHAGQWFTYVAYVSIIENICPGNNVVVSILVVLRLIPKLCLSSLGGALADDQDRRINIIKFDCASASVVLMYIFVLHSESLVFLFSVVFIEESIAALGEPSTSAILPMLVFEEEFLEKAAALVEVGYAVVATIGASAGGACAAMIGLRNCFLLDSATYVLSAYFMSQVEGQWIAAGEEDESSCEDHGFDQTDTGVSMIENTKRMIINGITYIWSGSVGPLIFLKSSGMLIYGATEVMTVSFSQRDGDENGNSLRLGIIFSFYGIGCIFGPFVSEKFTEMKNFRTLQIACVVSFGIISLSWVGMGYFTSFASKCVLMSLASFGAEVLWLDSNLLLMKFSTGEMLGRVTALDNALATLCEASSAALAGILQDGVGLSAEGLSWVMSVIGFFLVIIWCIRLFGGCVTDASHKNCDEKREPLESASTSAALSHCDELNATHNDGGEQRKQFENTPSSVGLLHQDFSRWHKTEQSPLLI